MMAGEALRRMEALPLATAETILDGRDPLVLAPHADDESLGCGGLIAEWCARGGRPHVLVVTDGTGSHPNSRLYPRERLRAVREAEAKAAVACLGLNAAQLDFMRLPDTAAPHEGSGLDAAVDRIVTALAERRCGVLLAPWRHDPHGDHLAVHRMALAAAARTGLPHLAYPVWGWTLPGPTPLDGPPPDGWRLDIARHLPAKRRAIAAHATQYTGLIDDDPTGFRLPAHLLARFDRPFETFLSNP